MEKVMFKNRYGFEFELYVNNPAKVNAVLVVAHGASEHFQRYQRLANYLEKHNIKVVGYDHLSHGSRQQSDKPYIYFGDYDGSQTLISDLEDVCLWTYQQDPFVPLILFGHSMGSLIARGLSMQTKLIFDGIILCGSIHPKKQMTIAGLTLAKTLAKFKKQGVSKLLNRIVFGNLENSISYNQENIDKYTQDKKCGQPFSNQALVDLLTLLNQIIDEENIEQMLKTKYFIISGKEDPFSNNTRQLITLMNEMDIARIEYRHKFYPNMRHEILNEKFNEQVYDDILKFCLSLND